MFDTVFVPTLNRLIDNPVVSTCFTQQTQKNTEEFLNRIVNSRYTFRFYDLEIAKNYFQQEILNLQDQLVNYDWKSKEDISFLPSSIFQVRPVFTYDEFMLSNWFYFRDQLLTLFSWTAFLLYFQRNHSVFQHINNSYSQIYYGAPTYFKLTACITCFPWFLFLYKYYSNLHNLLGLSCKIFIPETDIIFNSDKELRDENQRIHWLMSLSFHFSYCDPTFGGEYSSLFL